jgi:hypothetical protein
MLKIQHSDAMLLLVSMIVASQGVSDSRVAGWVTILYPQPLSLL